MIHRFSCIQVRTHHCKFHGIFCVGLTVKNIQLPGQFIISEFPAVYISCGDPVPDACKSFILAVLFVIAKNSSDLPGLIIASKNSSSRYAHRTVCVNLIFHQNIDHTGCIQASHTAALHNDTEFFQLCFFHLFVLCILSGRLCCPYAVIFMSHLLYFLNYIGLFCHISISIIRISWLSTCSYPRLHLPHPGKIPVHGR